MGPVPKNRLRSRNWTGGLVSTGDRLPSAPLYPFPPVIPLGQKGYKALVFLTEKLAGPLNRLLCSLL